jgi:hypothetical protein
MARLGEKGGRCVQLNTPQAFVFKTSIAVLGLLLRTYDMDGVVVAVSKPCDLYRKAIRARIVTDHPPYYIDLSQALGGMSGPQSAEDAAYISMFEPDRIDSAVRNGLQKVAEKYGGEEHFVLFDDLSAMEFYCSTETVKRFASTFFREMSGLNIHCFVMAPEEKASRLFGALPLSCPNRLKVQPEWL